MRVVNADRISATLSPADPASMTMAATTLAKAIGRDLVQRRESFVMETEFPDPAGAELDLLRDAQRRGYAIVLLFVGLESAELSAARVAERVAQGGHDVPDDRLLTRYPRTLANQRLALAFVDVAMLLDNSSARTPYRPVATWRAGRLESESPDPPSWLPR